MNLKPRTHRSLAAAVRAGVLQAVAVTVCFGGTFALVAHFAPVSMEMVVPEQGAAAVDEAADRAARQEARAMRRCDELPAGVLPGGVVMRWNDERGTVYSEEPRDVSLAFDVAVGVIELPAGSRLDGFTLCA